MAEFSKMQVHHRVIQAIKWCALDRDHSDLSKLGHDPFAVQVTLSDTILYMVDKGALLRL